MPDAEIGIAQQLLVESLARLSLKTRVLERLLGLYSGSLRGERRLAEIVAAALEAVPSDVAVVRLRNGEGELVVAAAAGREADRLRSVPLEPGRSLQGACLGDRRTVAMSDLAWDARHAAALSEVVGFAVRSVLSVPVMRDGEAIGILELVNKQAQDEFQRHEIELVERVARTAGDVLKPLA